MRRRAGLLFWAELAAAGTLLALLLVLALVTNAGATGTIAILLGSGGTGPYTLSSSLTAGGSGSGTGTVGYISGSIGSLSPDTLSGGLTVTEIGDFYSSSTLTEAVVTVSGFSTEPNQGWLGNVTCNGDTFNGAAATFTYSGGVGNWEWATSTGWGFSPTDGYSCTITYSVPYYSAAPSVTAGSNVVSGSGEIGYASGGLGSISGASLSGGYTITQVIDTESGGSIISCSLVVSGFSANPNRGWIGSATFNGVSFLASAVSSYSYSSGVATWTWSTSSGWGFSNGSTYPGTVSYQ